MSRSDPALARSSDERRCVCGSLLARLCSAGVELKCRRCKRVVTIPWSTSGSWHDVSLRCDGDGSGADG